MNLTKFHEARVAEFSTRSRLRIPKTISECGEYPADDYERQVVPYFFPIAFELARESAIKREESVLEVGAGTGLLTRLLAPIECRLIATDISMNMLSKAYKTLSTNKLPIPSVALASVTDLPFTSESFDVLVSNLTPLQDSIIALREARRVLNPNGRISLAMWGPSCSDTRLNNLALRAAGKRHLPYGAPLAAVRRLQSLGFDVERTDRTFLIEYETTDSYIDFRSSFGEPRDWSATDSVAYYGALRRLIDRQAKGGRVYLSWNVSYLTARRSRLNLLISS